MIKVCRYKGKMDDREPAFSKGDALACADHQWACMYRAVMTANAYACADYDESGKASTKREKQFLIQQ